MQFESGTTKKFKVKLEYTVWNDDREVWLNNIKVPAKLRNKGIGTSAMQEFIAWLDSMGYTCKLLFLKPEQEHWYNQFGFVKTENGSEMKRVANYQEHKDINTPSNIIGGMMFEEI